MTKTAFNQFLRHVKDRTYPNRIAARRRAMAGTLAGIASTDFHPTLRTKAEETARILGGLVWQDNSAFDGATFTQDWFPCRAAWDHFLSKERDMVHEYLEIGSFEGRSALFAAHLFSNARLTCIDTFGGSGEHTAPDKNALEARFLRNIAAIRDRVTVLKGTSLEQLAKLSGRAESFDVIYIDGCHFYRHAMLDTLMSWPLLKTGGVMIWDDYIWDVTDHGDLKPKKAVDQFLSAYSGDYETLFVTNQVAIRKIHSEQKRITS